VSRRALLLALLLWSPMGGVWAAAIEIKSVETRLRDEFYLLDARLEYRLTPAVVQALEAGVDMTFEVQVRVRRQGPRFWEYDILDRRLRYRLGYHALAAMYELQLPDHRQSLRFSTREAALRALGTLSQIKLLPSAHLEPDTDYQLQMEASLDIESLPVPLRPVAYLSADWKLGSGRRAWPLKP
jgi:hypothetical protein